MTLDVRAGGEVVDHFADWGIEAFTTGRAAGSFGMQTSDPVRDVTARWTALRVHLGGSAARLATSFQVHGNHVVQHGGGWQGFLRGPDADGHLSPSRGTAMAVTVADCVPVFLAHAERARVIRDERAKVYGGGCIHMTAGELPVHVRAHLIALPADRGAAVEAKLLCAQPEPGKQGDRMLGDPRGGAAPARMQKRDRA